MPSPELDRFITLLAELFSSGTAPAQFQRAEALRRVLNGEPIDVVRVGTNFSRSYLKTWSEALGAGHFYKWVRRKPPTDESLARARAGIAQMALGLAAETHFEASASQLLNSIGFKISDERPGATDTDYFLLDEDERPFCRINVKYHGSLFRQSMEYVGLPSEDCFPLATYKIQGALQRQSSEAVPYVFLVATVPGSPRSFVEKHISDDRAWLAAVSGRIVEEALAKSLLGQVWFRSVQDEVSKAVFRVISASRAHKLLHEKLFDRVFALRVRAFNWTFRGAEIDMHLSLSQEMVGFGEFVSLIQDRGVREVAIRLDRGEI